VGAVSCARERSYSCRASLSSTNAARARWHLFKREAIHGQHRDRIELICRTRLTKGLAKAVEQVTLTSHNAISQSHPKSTIHHEAIITCSRCVHGRGIDVCIQRMPIGDLLHRDDVEITMMLGDTSFPSSSYIPSQINREQTEDLA
jgi:hypothetical protein